MATTAPASILQPIQPGDLWAVAYGYHAVQGIEIAKQVDGAKTTWSIHVFGEGEWDGLDEVFVNKKLIYPNDAGWRVQFHPGKDGTLGAGLVPISTGGDQNVDIRFNQFPTLQPVTLSRLAYIALKTPFDPGAPSADLELVAHCRTKKVRTFDATGAQLSYAFSTNPWWILLDVLINNFIQRETTFNTALTAQEKLRINFPSFVTEAAYADTVLASGNKRFECSVAWPASTPLTNAIEQILLCARGYLIEVNGQFTAGSDKTKASTFILTDQHVAPGSFNMEKKLARPAADHFNANFRELSAAKIADVDDIIIDARRGFHVHTATPHGRQKGDSITLANISFDAGYNGSYVVAGSGSPQMMLLTTNNPVPAHGAGTYATTGQMLAPETKFMPRTEPGDHIAHQQSIGQRGAGLLVQPTPVSVDLDYGNNSEERVKRQLTYQKRRPFGDDATPYNGPWEGRGKAFYDAVDVNGSRLIDQLCGDFITIDRSVSEEFQGDYEILEIGLPQIKSFDSQSQSGDASALEVDLYVKQVVPSAYSDDGDPESTVGPASSYNAPPDPQLATNSCIIHILNANPANPRVRPTFSLRPFSFQPYVVQVGDFIEYDLFIDPNSIYGTYALQIGNSGGDPAVFFLVGIGAPGSINPGGNGTNAYDQNDVSADPSNGAPPVGVWYHRSIDVSALAGKTIDQWISEWYPTDNTNNTGACRGRIANVKVTNGGLLQQAVFFMQFVGPSIVLNEQDCIDVRVYTADNGVIPLPPSGKLMLPNPGFESNAALALTNTFFSATGSFLIDGWTLLLGSPLITVMVEDGGAPHGGARNLLFRIPAGAALPIGTTTVKASSDFLPILPNDVVAFGDWARADNTAALPGGLTVQHQLVLEFFDAHGTLITTTAGQIIQQNGNGYAYTQLQAQYVAPASAALLRVVVIAQFVNGSGGVINTAGNLYFDLRVDDVRLINRTRSFDSSPLDSSVTATNGGNILTQHVAAGVNQTQIDVGAWTGKRGFGFIGYNSGSVDPGVMGHWYVYIKDATFSGGAATYLATNDIGVLTSDESIVLVGDITTVANPGAAGSGGNGLDGGRGGAKR